MAARRVAAPSARTAIASARTATTASAGRTVSRNASVNDLHAPARPFADDEGFALAIRRRARAVVSRAYVGRRGRAQALPAARMDGRVRVLPVPGRRARARVAGAGARLARLRVVGDAAGRLLVSRLRRRPRRARACARAGRARRMSSATASAATSRCCGPARGPRWRRASSRSTRSAFPATPPIARPTSFATWLDALRDPPSFSPMRASRPSRIACRRPIRRLTREKAEFLAPHWAEELPDGTARLRADARHKLPFPTTSRIDDVYAIWRRIACPVLWIAADDSHVPRWLSPQGDPREEIARRFAHVPNGTLEYVSDASHMLHHDQPHAVARLIEAFLGADARAPARAHAARRVRRARGADTDLGIQLDRVEVRAGSAPIPVDPQRASHLDRGDRAVCHPALAAAPVLADVVDGRRRHRVLPDDGELQRDDARAGRRRRRAAHPCSCSRCRSGRSSSRGPCCTSA